MNRKFRCEPIACIAYGSITNSYTLIGSFANPSVQIYLYNGTNAEVMISFDQGAHDNLLLPAAGFYLSDVMTNKPSADGLYFPAQDGFYVKYTSGAPSSGSVCVTSFYVGE